MNYDLQFDHIIILYYSIKLDKYGCKYPILIGLPHVSTSISLHMTPNWELLCLNSCWAFSTFQVANKVLTWGLFKRTHDPKHWSLSCLNSCWVLLTSRIKFQLCLQIKSQKMLPMPMNMLWKCPLNMEVESSINVLLDIARCCTFWWVADHFASDYRHSYPNILEFFQCQTITIRIV